MLVPVPSNHSATVIMAVPQTQMKEFVSWAHPPVCGDVWATMVASGPGAWDIRITGTPVCAGYSVSPKQVGVGRCGCTRMSGGGGSPATAGVHCWWCDVQMCFTQDHLPAASCILTQPEPSGPPWLGFFSHSNAGRSASPNPLFSSCGTRPSGWPHQPPAVRLTLP